MCERTVAVTDTLAQKIKKGSSYDLSLSLCFLLRCLLEVSTHLGKGGRLPSQSLACMGALTSPLHVSASPVDLHDRASQDSCLQEYTDAPIRAHLLMSVSRLLNKSSILYKYKVPPSALNGAGSSNTIRLLIFNSTKQNKAKGSN